MFAMDSESPPFPYINPEDRPIEQIMFNTQMNIQMEEFLAMDNVPSNAFVQVAQDRPSADLWTGYPRSEWGQNKPDWVSGLSNFKSAPVYRKEINRFLLYHESQRSPSEQKILPNLKTYFSDNFDDDKTPKDQQRAAPTMRSVFSVMKKFWRYTERGNLMLKAPLICDQLNTWDKAHTTNKAEVYSRADL
ncbi:hypothetical protein B484DRAFT_406779, partial [Ochromonadaceae sp. CCMP2298]